MIYFYLIIQLLNQLFVNFFYILIKLKKKENVSKKIAINYAFDFEDPNSNVWWLEKLNIPKKDIIYYFSEIGSKVKATDEIVTKILNKGYSVKILNKSLNQLNKINGNKEIFYISRNDILFLFKSSFSLFKNTKEINFLTCSTFFIPPP